MVDTCVLHYANMVLNPFWAYEEPNNSDSSSSECTISTVLPDQYEIGVGPEPGFRRKCLKELKAAIDSEVQSFESSIE